MMKKLLVLTTGFAAITLALLFAISVRSFAAGGPPLVPPVSGQLYGTACVQKTNSNARITDCSSDADCKPEEVCVFLGSTHGCSSLIGGGFRTPSNGGPITWSNGVNRYFAYFLSTDSPLDAGQSIACQSVEEGGSFRNLNVVLTNNPGVGNDVIFSFVRNGVVPINAPSCTASGGNPLAPTPPFVASDLPGCDDAGSDHCVDVNPGDCISLRAHPMQPTWGTVNPLVDTKINHTMVFNECICCDGLPPDEYGHCVRPTPEPWPED